MANFCNNACFSFSILSIIKFVKVVGWYMHLAEDHTMLKLIFIFPVLIAFVVCGGLTWF